MNQIHLLDEGRGKLEVLLHPSWYMPHLDVGAIVEPNVPIVILHELTLHLQYLHVVHFLDIVGEL